MKFISIIVAIIFTASFLIYPLKTFAQETVNVYFFWGDGCPHCKKESQFLEKLAIEDPNLIINSYEVWYNSQNRELLQKAGDILQTEINGVPFLVIGKQYIVGYRSDDTTGADIRNLIIQCRANGCEDIFAPEKSIAPLDPESVTEDPVNNSIARPTLQPSPPSEQPKPNIPTFANIDLSKLSLPFLTIVLGFLDGFNPCAMWTLLFLISLLLGMQNRRKMWALGIAFIVASAFVYFLFMVAWLNLLLFIGFISWIRIIIGIIALTGAVFSLKKAFTSQTGCDVTNNDKRQSIFQKLGKITSNKSFILALIGIIGLAFAVNLVELICSAGLPAVYTQVLALNNLSLTQYYLYILLYILFFMIDDLFVFIVAMVTLQATGITTKYVKYSRLIGGVLMLIIGLLLIFKPEVLMMG